MFETWLHGARAHGLNVVEYQPDGLVGELTVFFRPLVVLELIADTITGDTEQRFSSPRRRR
jgi:hypothetical protein